MKKIEPIKREMDFSLLVSLMKGETVILCGSENEPNIYLTLEQEGMPENQEDACWKLENEWEW